MRYVHVDVFTERPFEGNQLAVFPEPQGLSAEMMQTITREMNFSECTFIFPPERGGDVRMRIFTPREELPIAGHPVIGSTFALVEEGRIARGRTDFMFELGVGPTPVSLAWNDRGLDFAWMTQPLPTFGAVVGNRAALAAAAGIEERDLADYPLQVVSCGVPYLMVPITSRTAVDSVSIDRKALVRVLHESGANELPVFIFTRDRAANSGEETVYSRMIAPGFGIVEDPATGSASGPLGCYLLRHGIVTPDAARSLLSLQGVAMQRPSRIYIAIDSVDGNITAVRVGGKAVMVGRGEIDTRSAAL